MSGCGLFVLDVCVCDDDEKGRFKSMLKRNGVIQPFIDS